MKATLEIKNGKATIRLENRKDITLPVVDRGDIKAKYQKFAVKDGKAIVSVWALPKFNGKVTLNEVGTSAHAHKFGKIETAKLIVGSAYIAKQGQKMTVR